MGLPPGQYLARLYGWDIEKASGRRFAKVTIERDESPFAEVIFGLNGGAFVRIKSFVDPGTKENADERTMRALTMVVQDRMRRALESAEVLPGSLEISEDEIVTATQYARAVDELEISLEPDSVLFKKKI